MIVRMAKGAWIGGRRRGHRILSVREASGANPAGGNSVSINAGYSTWCFDIHAQAHSV